MSETKNRKSSFVFFAASFMVLLGILSGCSRMADSSLDVEFQNKLEKMKRQSLMSSGLSDLVCVLGERISSETNVNGKIKMYEGYTNVLVNIAFPPPPTNFPRGPIYVGPVIMPYSNSPFITLRNLIDTVNLKMGNGAGQDAACLKLEVWKRFKRELEKCDKVVDQWYDEHKSEFTDIRENVYMKLASRKMILGEMRDIERELERYCCTASGEESAFNDLFKMTVEETQGGEMKVSVDVRRKIADEMARLQNAALTNFTEEGVARFSDRVDALVSSFPGKSRMRRELAEMFADKTAQLLMEKMIEGEKSSDFSTAGLCALSNRLTAACCLIERQWRNSVLCDRVIRGFDVSWVNYLNRESQRQRDSGKLEFAAVLADFAARLDALADSPTGPLKMSFDQYCQAFGNIPKATPEIVNKTLKNYLDGEIRKGLGHYPAWAARWCRMSMP